MSWMKEEPCWNFISSKVDLKSSRWKVMGASRYSILIILRSRSFFPGSEKPKSKLASKTKIAWQIESKIQSIKICRIKNWFKSIEKGHHQKWKVTKQLKLLKIKMKGFVCLWARKKEVEELYIPLGTLKKNFPFVQWKFSQPTMLHNVKSTYHREPVWVSSSCSFLPLGIQSWESLTQKVVF